MRLTNPEQSAAGGRRSLRAGRLVRCCQAPATWLAALALLAVGLRVAAVLAVASYRLEHVTYEHGEIARNIVEGRGFSVRWMGGDGPTSQQAPVYPLIVAGFYAVFGVQTPAAVAGVQLFQALLGGVLALSLCALAWELMPQQRAVGWIAGAWVAAHPTLVYMATQIQVVSVATLGVVLVLWSAGRGARTGSWRAAAGSGLAAGLLILTDPILGLVAGVACLMIASRPCAARRRALVRAAAMAAVCSAVIAPWCIRNYAVHGELVPVKSTFGYAFWQGNHPRSFGTDKIPLAAQEATMRRAAPGVSGLERTLWHARMIDTLYIDDAVLSNERIAELGRFSEPERSRRLMAEVVAYIRAWPLHYARLCAQRLRYFLLFDETNPKSRVWSYRASELALAACGVAGLWRSRRRAAQLWPTYLVFGLVAAFHTLTIVSARFRIPLEPVQILWAACLFGETGLQPTEPTAQVASCPGWHARESSKRVRVGLEPM